MTIADKSAAQRELKCKIYLHILWYYPYVVLDLIYSIELSI